MRFPLALSCKIAAHILRHKIRRTKKFATVLQLEPLHACNLSCAGCCRIREYSASLKESMSLEDCLGAARESGAPMISICGGEPLIYPHIEELVHGLLAQKRIVYLCTNAILMRGKMRDYLAFEHAKRPARIRPLLQKLLSEELVSPMEAETIRHPKKTSLKKVIAPSRWMYWNVHLDGLEATHDRMVEREGVFKECILAIRMAKILGYQVATNTTVYRETDMKEIEQLFESLSELGVDGHTISPGFGYDTAKAPGKNGSNGNNFFLTRKATIEKFKNAEELGRRFPLFGTPMYLEFLAGKRELSCAAWAIPTRNVRGWKGPCYLITDGHFQSYKKLLESVRWDEYGVVGGVAKDVRCENCMLHCGYEPSATLGLNARPGDAWRNFKFNFLAPKPKPKPASKTSSNSLVQPASKSRPLGSRTHNHPGSNTSASVHS